MTKLELLGRLAVLFDDEAAKRKIRRMRTISQGHMDRLVAENKTIRLWVSRMTPADGMAEDQQVLMEKLIDGRWEAIQ